MVSDDEDEPLPLPAPRPAPRPAAAPSAPEPVEAEEEQQQPAEKKRRTHRGGRSPQKRLEQELRKGSAPDTPTGLAALPRRVGRGLPLPPPRGLGLPELLVPPRQRPR